MKVIIFAKKSPCEWATCTGECSKCPASTVKAHRLVMTQEEAQKWWEDNKIKVRYRA